MNTRTKLAVRIDGSNPDHHLWCNNGTFWLHCTVHLGDGSALRLRRSLRTRDRSEARLRRDKIFDAERRAS